MAGKNNPLLEGLTTEQRAAVTHTDGPCLVVAGAGTGKTRVLTNRLAYLVTTKVARPDEILALTFTEKAATEMAERVDSLLPLGSNTAAISTFHGFTNEVLRQYAHFIGLPADFALLTEEEELVLLRDHLFDLPLKLLRPGSNPTKFLDKIIGFFNTMKDEAITAEQLESYATKLTGDEAAEDQRALYLELAAAFTVYEQLLKEQGYLTFGHCITETIALLRAHPAVLAELRQRYRYILVDEYQDTNWAQTELAALLAGDNGNLMAVGDDDQAIYSFRGAAASNLMDFKKRFPQTKQIVLTQNFRSTQEILDTAYRTIQHNNPDRLEYVAKIDKRLTTDEHGENPTFQLYDKLASEIAEIVTKVKGWLDEGIAPQEIAVLTRSRSHATTIAQSLVNSGVAVSGVTTTGLYQIPLIIGLTAFLRLLVNPHNNLACFNVLAKPPLNIDPSSLHRLLAARPYKTDTYYTYLEDVINQPPAWLPESDVRKLNRIFTLHKELAPIVGEKPSTGFLRLIHQSELYDKLLKTNTPQSEQQLERLGQLFETMQEYEQRHKEATLGQFLNYLDILLDNERDPINDPNDADPFAVNVLTIHKSKGLEFTAVIIAHCVNGRFPSRRQTDTLALPASLRHETPPTSDAHLLEERRLFYVAVTRAKKYLHCTAALRYGDTRTAKISPFIYEAYSEELLKTAAVTVPAKDYLQATLDFSAPAKVRQNVSSVVVSHTNLESFISCPQQYKYRAILKVKVYPISATLNFGNSVHNTLSTYFNARKRGETPDVAALYQQCWISGGYESRDQEHERKIEGLTAVKQVIADAGDTIPERLEWNFTVPLASGDRLTGRIDRIDRHADGTVSIIDYKTGQVSDAGKAKPNQQLGMYIYAVEKSQPITIKDVTLYYVTKETKVTVSRADFQLEKVTDQVMTAVKELKEATNEDNFVAKPDKFTCQWCDYKNICPFRYNGNA